MCVTALYPPSPVYAAINSVYTLGKVFPKQSLRGPAGFSPIPLSILLCYDLLLQPFIHTLYLYDQIYIHLIYIHTLRHHSLDLTLFFSNHSSFSHALKTPVEIFQSDQGPASSRHLKIRKNKYTHRFVLLLVSLLFIYYFYTNSLYIHR